MTSGRGKGCTHDRNIFKKNVEFFGSVQKVISDPSRNDLSICDQFRGYIRAHSLVKDHSSKIRKSSHHQTERQWPSTLRYQWREGLAHRSYTEVLASATMLQGSNKRLTQDPKTDRSSEDARYPVET